MTVRDDYGKTAPRYCRNAHEGGYKLMRGRGKNVFRCAECKNEARRRSYAKKKSTTPSTRTRIPVAVVTEQIERAFRLDPFLTYGQMCQRMDWYRPNGTPDTDRLRRALGEKPDSGKLRENLNETTAVAIMRAIHVDPWEIGL